MYREVSVKEQLQPNRRLVGIEEEDMEAKEECKESAAQFEDERVGIKPRVLVANDEPLQLMVVS